MIDIIERIRASIPYDLYELGNEAIVFQCLTTTFKGVVSLIEKFDNHVYDMNVNVRNCKFETKQYFYLYSRYRSFMENHIEVHTFYDNWYSDDVYPQYIKSTAMREDTMSYMIDIKASAELMFGLYQCYLKCMNRHTNMKYVEIMQDMYRGLRGSNVDIYETLNSDYIKQVESFNTSQFRPLRSNLRKHRRKINNDLIRCNTTVKTIYLINELKRWLNDYDK